jgi:outer membrane protein OmpA-like peptidoglycan-associated protein
MRLSWFVTSLIWIIAIGAGTVGSYFYQGYVSQGRVSLGSRVKQYEADWDKLLKCSPDRLLATAQPSAQDVVTAAPLGQQAELQKRLAVVDQRYLLTYADKVNQAFDKRITEFRGKLEDALENFGDNPSIAEAVKDVHEGQREKLQAKLKDLEKDWDSRHPRIKLAIDSFSGYCIFRSEEFCSRVAKLNIPLHLADDGADYKKRIQTLQDSTTPLAVFTLDALINNSARFDVPPAAAVLLIDETRGADAMIGYKSGLKDIDSMNRPDLKVVLTPDSPSETLARLVRSEFNLRKAPRECFVEAQGAGAVYERFLKADPSEPTAFVLWEPYVSKALKQRPDAQILLDSSRFRGYIVDVLVVQKDYLHKNPDQVEALVQAYLEAAAEYQKKPNGMVKLVMEDSRKLGDPLSEEEAQQVVKGIAWKTAQDNYGHFGLQGGSQSDKVQPLDEMINNISSVLIKTRATTKSVKPASLYDGQLCARLQKNGFDAGGAATTTTPVSTTPTDDWSKLKRVGALDVEAIVFGTGSSTLPGDAEITLDAVAQKMKNFPQYSLEVRGNARGKTEADADLAKGRATAVVNWLQEKGGIDSQRLRAVGVPGSEEPSGVTFVFYEAAR